MKKKRVWIINQYSITPEYPASTRHYELAKYLSKYYDVDLFGSNFIHHNKTFRFSKWTIFKNERMDNFNFIWIGAISYYTNGMFRMINMLLYAIVLLIVGLFKKKPNTIIGSSPTLFTAFSAMILAKLKRSVFYMEVRDLWPESLEIKNNKKNMIYRLLQWMEHQLYKRADQIIVLTEGIKHRLIDKGINEKKIIFLPNGIDIETIPNDLDPLLAARDAIRKLIGVSKDDILFIYAGAHGPANDLEQIVHAADALKAEQRIKFAFIGEGIEKEKIRSLVQRFGLVDKVLLLPGVAKSKVHEYLACGDGFIISLKDIPLFEGALPNKIFDYLIYDKPIITTVKGEIENFLSKYHAGYYGNMKETGEHYLPTLLTNIASGTNRPNTKIPGLEIIKTYFNRAKQADFLSQNINLSLQNKK